MTVKEFTEGYNNAENKKTYISENLRVADYAPYNTKIAYAENIVKNTCLDATGEFKLDTPQLELMIDWSMLRIYTDLQLDPQNVIEEYDMLGKGGLLVTLREYISDKTHEDFDAFSNIVFEKKDDLRDNLYEIHHFIAKCVMSLSPMVTPLLEQVATLLSQIDTDTISNTIMGKIGATNDN